MVCLLDMTRTFVAMCFFVAAFLVHAEDIKFGVNLSNTLKSGETQSYTFSVDPGDLISGNFDLKFTGLRVTIWDSTGTKVRTMELSDPGPADGGLAVAPSTGKYRLDITATGKSGGSISLSLRKVSASTRMAGQHAEPRETYKSARIERLKRDVHDAKPGALEEFWAEAAKGHGSIVEPIKDDDQNLLVTFLWKETYETYNVLLDWRPHDEEYYMGRVPGTDVWYKTVRIRQGSRFSYRISPNDRAEDRDDTTQTDPLNPRIFPDDMDRADVNSSSVFKLPGAPDEKWFRDTPTKRGAVVHTTPEPVSIKNEGDVWIYTPPGYQTTASPYPLLVLLNGLPETPTILDNLIAAGKIRPVIAISTGGFGPTLSAANTAASELPGEVLAKEIVPWMRSHYAISTDPSDVVIGGWSWAGTASSYVALRHPDVFGNVFSQSGAFRGRKSGDSEPNTLARLYLESPRVPIRFYIDAGLYDNIPGLPIDELAIDETNTQGNRHFRDVLKAKGYDVIYRETGGGHSTLHWRATLPEALMALLGTNK